LTEDKPLHVRVAEALHPELATWQVTAKPDDITGGMVFLEDREWSEPGEWLHVTHDTVRRVPHYDTDWSATGPLIERLHVTLESPSSPTAQTLYAGDPCWRASWNTGCPYPHYGAPAEQDDAKDECICHDGVADQTPLLAVCALILALAEAGRLPK
jgi:hypothetical protein